MATGKVGRPRRVESEAATERIWARLTPSERRALEDFARQCGETIGAIVRDAIVEYVAECRGDGAI